jgi:hypothetical protein
MAWTGVDNDGSSAFRFVLTPVRIVCANTQTVAIGRAKASFSIRHTGGARAAIQEARSALGLSWRYIEAFEDEAAALYAEAMSVDEVHNFAEKLVKLDEINISLAATGQRRDKANGIVKLFVSSTLPTANIRIMPLTCADTTLTCWRRWGGVGRDSASGCCRSRASSKRW